MRWVAAKLVPLGGALAETERRICRAALSSAELPEEDEIETDEIPPPEPTVKETNTVPTAPPAAGG